MSREIFISIFISLLFTVKILSAEESINVAYTIVDNLSAAPSSSLSRVIFIKDNIVKSFPLKIIPIKSFNKFFAYSKVDSFSDSKREGFIYFEGSSSNLDFGFYNFRSLVGDIQTLKDEFREVIKELRNSYESGLEGEKELNQSIVRLRKDARLIAGYDKIELLEKQKANLGFKIEEVRNKKQFLEKMIASTQESEIPRNYQNRLEDLIVIIKNLAKAEGSKINLEEIFSTAYAETESEDSTKPNTSDKATSSELNSELEYLIDKRKELEKYFGYEEDEFSIGVNF